MAGISDAVLVIEAGQKSGTMITSRLALDYNRNILAVPGSIFNLNSIGTNNLIKDGAVPVTNSGDILYALGFGDDQISLFKELEDKKKLDEIIKDLSVSEKIIINILSEPKTVNQITEKTSLPINIIIQTLTELEMKNLIKESGGLFYLKSIS